MNRTLWPLTGGTLALNFDSSRPLLISVNLALGTIPTAFNISLTPQELEIEGDSQSAFFCMPKVNLPVGTPIVEGRDATLQVVVTEDVSYGRIFYSVSVFIYFSL